jgi:hypothetical protein
VVAGIVLSQHFGHGAQTDGFFAAYAVYLALALVATALRVVVLPGFARARADGRLAGELGTWLVAVAIPCVPAVLVAIFLAKPVASVLTGSATARDAAAQLLPWLVPAAVAQIGAGVFASALAALDEYVVSALGFTAGAVVGVGGILLFVSGGHGVVALGWGIALNGVISLAVPLVAVWRRRAVGFPDGPPVARLRELVDGVSLPFALQGLYVLANRFAGGIAAGTATTLSYAYLAAATLVAVTASSVALVATVPFAREQFAPSRVGRHVGAIAWVSLVPAAAVTGVVAVAGSVAWRHVLGAAYGGTTGAELSRLVVAMAPWMAMSIAVTVAFPLLFVRGRARWLPTLAVGVLLLHVFVEWAGRRLAGVDGVAVGMAVTTTVVLAAVLCALQAVVSTLRRLTAAVAVCAALAIPAFALGDFAGGPVVAAAVGLALYTAAVAAWRPRGLRDAWAYLHALQ